MSAVKYLRAPLVVAAAALTLAACATDAEESGSASTTPEGDATETSATASAAAEETTPQEALTEVTVATAQGEATVPFQPERVVVIEHGVLDTIDYLGASESVVAIPHHVVPTYLADYETSTENAGTLFEPDFEAINAAEPDLIIVGGRSAALLPDLEAIAPTIDLSYGWGTDALLASLESNTLALGQIFGVEDEAAAALEDLSAQQATIAEDAADAGTGLVLMTNAGEVSAYGPSPEGRYDFVYGALGITPAIDQVAIDEHGDAISFEFIAETNPDLLIVLDRDAALGTEAEAAAAVLDNDLVNATSAATEGNVVYVDTENWYLSFGGLTAMNAILDEVASVVD